MSHQFQIGEAQTDRFALAGIFSSSLGRSGQALFFGLSTEASAEH
jgi:hypothetical protein